MSRTKRTEAKLVSYTLFYDLTGKLVTERTSTDIKDLEKFFTPEEYNTLKTVPIFECLTIWYTIFQFHHKNSFFRLNARYYL